MNEPEKQAPTDGVRELLLFAAITVAAYVSCVLILAAAFGALRLS